MKTKMNWLCWPGVIASLASFSFTAAPMVAVLAVPALLALIPVLDLLP